MHRQATHIDDLLGPGVAAMGYEYVGAELVGGAGQQLLRVYIDSEAGISVDDCAAVSRQISALLDVEDPVPGRYDLEVSSPGLDRPLFSVAHFERFAGARVKIKLHAPVDGRRKIVGTLGAVNDDTLEVWEQGVRQVVHISHIAKARLVPEID